MGVPGRGTAVTAVAVVVAVLSVYLQHLITAFDEPFWGLFDNQLDLNVYRAGAQTVLDGQPLYSAKLLGQMDYTYAPISIALFLPFAAVPFLAARIVWSAAILVALYLVVAMSFRALGRPLTWRLRTIAVAVVAVSTLSEPVRSTIWFGQVNVFIMAVVLWDLLRPEGSRLRGFATGIAAGIKLTPLIFVAHLLVTRRWREASMVIVGFATTIAIAFVLLPNDSRTYWGGTFADSDRVGDPNTVGNQSIRGAIANLTATDAPSTAMWLAIAAAAVVLGLGAAALAERRNQRLLSLTLVGLTSCAVSPMSWGHHWVWIVPLAVIGLHHLMNARNRVVALVTGMGLTVLVLTTFAWRTHLPGPLFYVASMHPYALYTGLFFKNSVSWLRWFTVEPYNWVFVVAALSTVVFLIREPSDYYASQPTAETSVSQTPR